MTEPADNPTPHSTLHVPKRTWAWVVVVAIIAVLIWQLPQTIAMRDAAYRAFAPMVDVRSEIHKRSIRAIDDRTLLDAAVRAGIDAMMNLLDDPFAVYMTDTQYQRFRKKTEGVFAGPGLEIWKTDAGFEVLSRAPGSSAEQAKIMPGDLILEVDQQPLADLPLEEVENEWLAGAAGTQVLLRVRSPQAGRPAEERDVTLRRAELHVIPVRGWRRIDNQTWDHWLDPENRIAYLRLTRFLPGTDREMNRVIRNLLQEKPSALILDLRHNSGGLMEEAVRVADRFLQEGLILRTVGRRSDEQKWEAKREGTWPAFPLAVLIDGATASSAEIVAGALQDLARATVFGERSFGKGSVQVVVPLREGNGAIKLTSAYYYLPGGRCLHRTPQAEAMGQWGVVPTRIIDLTEEQRERWRRSWRATEREIGTAPSDDAQAGRRSLLEDDRVLAAAYEFLRASSRKNDR